MKRICLITILFIMSLLPCNSSPIEESIDNSQTKIFIYHIPEIEEIVQSDEENTTEEKPLDIISDDITADTSGVISEDENLDNSITSNYELSDMYTDVLHGYAVYDDYEEDTIVLEDTLENYQTLNIKRPTRVVGGKYLSDKKLTARRNKQYSKYNNMEYQFSQFSAKNSKSFGGFSHGTIYEQKIDYAELRQSTGFYTRYDTKYFAFSTEYSKTLNSTNSNYNDTFSFSPELKLNQYFTLKETLTSNPAKNLKIAEFILSINPFGDKDKDRLRFELGTSSVFDHANVLVKNRFKFSTRLKL